MKPRLVHHTFWVLLLIPVLAGPVQSQTTLGLSWLIPEEPFCGSQLPDLAALPDGGFWIVWSEQDPETGDFRLLGRELGPDARPHGDVVPIGPSGFRGFRSLTAVAPGGVRTVVWSDHDATVWGRAFAPDGTPLGSSFPLFDSPLPPNGLVAGPDGDFLVTGVAHQAVFATRFKADGSGLVTTREILDGEAPDHVSGALLNNGDAVLAVERKNLLATFPPTELWRLASDGAIAQRAEVPEASNVSMALRPDGELLLVYERDQNVFAERRGPGLGLVSSFELEDVPFDEVGQPPDLAVSPDGESFVVTWWTVVAAPSLPSAEPGPVQTTVHARRYDFDGTRQGFPEVLTRIGGTGSSLWIGEIAFTSDGHLGIAWWVPRVVPVDPVPACASSNGVFAGSTAPSCGGDLETTLCLQDERFALTVEWSDPRSGDAGAGHPVDLTGDTGAFWFFDPNNLEMMVKVIDGRPVNGHFWLFYGSLTDVELTLTVTDRDTGIERTFTKPPFVFASEGDTTAFPVP